MFPTIYFTDVTAQLALIWAEPTVVWLFVLSLALAIFPKVLRILRGVAGRR